MSQKAEGIVHDIAEEAKEEGSSDISIKTIGSFGLMSSQSGGGGGGNRLTLCSSNSNNSAGSSSNNNKPDIKVSADGVAKLNFSFLEENCDSSLEPGEVVTPPQCNSPVPTKLLPPPISTLATANVVVSDSQLCKEKVRAILEIDAKKRKEENEKRKLDLEKRRQSGELDAAEEQKRIEKAERKRIKRIEREQRAARLALMSDDSEEQQQQQQQQRQQAEIFGVVGGDAVEASVKLKTKQQKQRMSEDRESYESGERVSSSGDEEAVNTSMPVRSAGKPLATTSSTMNLMSNFHTTMPPSHLDGGMPPVGPVFGGPPGPAMYRPMFPRHMRPDFHHGRGGGFALRGRGIGCGIRGGMLHNMRHPQYRAPFISNGPRGHAPFHGLLRQPHPPRGHSPITAPHSEVRWTKTLPSITYSQRLRNENKFAQKPTQKKAESNNTKATTIAIDDGDEGDAVGAAGADCTVTKVPQASEKVAAEKKKKSSTKKTAKKSSSSTRKNDKKLKNKLKTAAKKHSKEIATKEGHRIKKEKSNFKKTEKKRNSFEKLGEVHGNSCCGGDGDGAGNNVVKAIQSVNEQTPKCFESGKMDEDEIRKNHKHFNLIVQHQPVSDTSPVFQSPITALTKTTTVATAATTSPMIAMKDKKPETKSNKLGLFDIFADDDDNVNDAKSPKSLNSSTIESLALKVENSKTIDEQVSVKVKEELSNQRALTPPLKQPKKPTAPTQIQRALEMQQRIGKLLQDDDLLAENLEATKEKLLQKTQQLVYGPALPPMVGQRQPTTVGTTLTDVSTAKPKPLQMPLPLPLSKPIPPPTANEISKFHARNNHENMKQIKTLTSSHKSHEDNRPENEIKGKEEQQQSHKPNESDLRHRSRQCQNTKSTPLSSPPLQATRLSISSSQTLPLSASASASSSSTKRKHSPHSPKVSSTSRSISTKMVKLDESVKKNLKISNKSTASTRLSFNASEFLFPEHNDGHYDDNDDDDRDNNNDNAGDFGVPHSKPHLLKIVEKSANSKNSNSPDTEDYMDNWELDDDDGDVDDDVNQTETNCAEKLFARTTKTTTATTKAVRAIKIEPMQTVLTMPIPPIVSNANNSSVRPTTNSTTVKPSPTTAVPVKSATMTTTPTIPAMQDIYNEFIKSVDATDPATPFTGVNDTHNNNDSNNKLTPVVVGATSATTAVPQMPEPSALASLIGGVVETAGTPAKRAKKRNLSTSSNSSESSSSSTTSSSSSSGSSSTSSSTSSSDSSESSASSTKGKEKQSRIKIKTEIKVEAEESLEEKQHQQLANVSVVAAKDAPVATAISKATAIPATIAPTVPTTSAVALTNTEVGSRLDPTEVLKSVLPPTPNEAEKQQIARDLKRIKSYDANLKRIQLMRANFDSTDDIYGELAKMEKLFKHAINFIIQKYTKDRQLLLQTQAADSSNSNSSVDNILAKPADSTLISMPTQLPPSNSKETATVNKIFDSNRETIKLTLTPLKLTKAAPAAIFDKLDNKSAAGFIATTGAAATTPKQQEEDADFTEALIKPKEIAIVKPMSKSTDRRASLSPQRRGSGSRHVNSRSSSSKKMPPRSERSSGRGGANERERDRRRSKSNSRSGSVYRTKRSSSRSRSRLSSVSREQQHQRRQRTATLSVSPERQRGHKNSSRSSSGHINSRYSEREQRQRGRSRSPQRRLTPLARRGTVSPIQRRGRSSLIGGRRSYSRTPSHSISPPRTRSPLTHARYPHHHHQRGRPHSPHSPSPPSMATAHGRDYSRDRYSRSPLPFKPPSPPEQDHEHTSHKRRSSSRCRRTRSRSRTRSRTRSYTRSRSRSLLPRSPPLRPHTPPMQYDHEISYDIYHDSRSPPPPQSHQQQHQQQHAGYFDAATASYYYAVPPENNGSSISAAGYANYEPQQQQYQGAAFMPQLAEYYAGAPHFPQPETHVYNHHHHQQQPQQQPPPHFYYNNHPHHHQHHAQQFHQVPPHAAHLQTPHMATTATGYGVPSGNNPSSSSFAVQKGNVLEIVPSVLSPSTSAAPATASNAIAAPTSTLKSAVAAGNATPKPTKPIDPIKSEIQLRLQLSAELKKTRTKPTSGVELPSNATKSSILRKEITTETAQDNATAAGREQEKETVANASKTLTKKPRKKVLFEDGLFPNYDSGNEDERDAEERLDSEIRRLSHMGRNAITAMYLLSERRRGHKKKPTWSELAKLPPPPPPTVPPLTQMYIEQPVLNRPPTPPHFMYYHYDALVHCLYTSTSERGIPPRLTDPKAAAIFNSRAPPPSSSSPSIKPRALPYAYGAKRAGEVVANLKMSRGSSVSPQLMQQQQSPYYGAVGVSSGRRVNFQGSFQGKHQSLQQPSPTLTTPTASPALHYHHQQKQNSLRYAHGGSSSPICPTISPLAAGAHYAAKAAAAAAAVAATITTTTKTSAAGTFHANATSSPQMPMTPTYGPVSPATSASGANTPCTSITTHQLHQQQQKRSPSLQALKTHTAATSSPVGFPIALVPQQRGVPPPSSVYSNVPPSMSSINGNGSNNMRSGQVRTPIPSVAIAIDSAAVAEISTNADAVVAINQNESLTQKPTHSTPIPNFDSIS